MESCYSEHDMGTIRIDLPLIDHIEIRVAWLRRAPGFAKIDLTALVERRLPPPLPPVH